uniref:Rab-GAP TBC domain-containing protein n=1 Tax=Esox lucius TaxID=8010 RepID=A0AAY5LDJ1_ESOLU
MLSVSTPTQITPGGEDSSESDRGSEVGVPLPATETDRFGFILGNGSTASGIRSEGPPPELVRQREAKWISIISQWDRVLLKKSSKIKEQCQKGIPASLRAKCWPLLSGATDRMRLNKDLYQTLDSRPALQSWVDIIERDLDRQFPFHEMFLSRDGHGQRGLFRVLKAFTQLRPEEGYCQAQGPVAAVLLMNMPTEEAFWCLVQISELYLPGYYSPLLEGVLFDAAMLTWVLKKMCPAAHKHMQRHEVDPLMFATDWLMCLFTRHLPFNTLLRVWDLFFCYGVRVLFQVAVVLVRRALGRVEHREECDGQMETLERLRGVKEHVLLDDDAFIAEVCSVPLSGKDLDKQTEKELEKWRKERPASTFDPRGRCHGYRTVWARAREREERNKKQREKVNMSLHINRSPSTLSLSPSVFRKRQKRGSKSDPYEGEGGCRGVSEVPEEVWEEQRDGGIFRRASETGEGPSRTQGVPPTPKDRVPFKPKGQEARTQDSDPRQELTSQRQRKNQGQTFRAPEAQDTSHSQDNVETQEILNTQSTGRANVITEHMVTETPGEEEESEEVEEAAKTRDKTLTDKHTRQDIQTHAEPKRAGDMETEKTSEILTDESAETGMATDAKQGADTNTGSLTGRHTETDTQSLTGRHTETDTRSLTGRHTETDTATDTDKEVEAGIEVQLQTGAETETCADTKSEVERPDEAEVYPEAETLGECDSTIHIDADTLAEAETDSGSQMEAVKNTEGPVNTEVGTEGPVHKEEEGPANKEEEGPVHKEEEGPVNTEVETEGPVNTEVETEVPVNTEVETEVPVNTEVETEVPVNTEVGTEVPVNTEVGTEGPVNTEVGTEGPVNTEVETEGPVNTEVETEGPVNTETEGPVNTEVEVPVNTEVEVPVNTEVKTKGPVNKEIEEPVNKVVETEGPINNETKVLVNIKVETEGPVHKETETLANKKTEEPVNKEVERPVDTKVEGPVNKEIEKEGPINKEVEGTVNKEGDEYVTKEVDTPVNTEIEGPVKIEVEEGIEKPVESPNEILVHTEAISHIEVRDTGTEPCGTTPVTSSPEPEVEGDSPDGPGQEKTATDEPQGPVTMPPGLCQDASESEEAREDVFPLPSQEVSADIITALQPGEPLRADISHIPGNKASERGKSDSPLVEPKADSGSSVAAPADASSRRTLPGDGPWAVPAGDFRLRKSSSSRRHTRKLSAELFTDPNQSQPASNQSQPASNQSQPASNQSNASLVASGQTQATPSAPVQAAVPPESPRRVTGTTSTPPPPQAGLKPDREPPNTPRRFGLFRLLRGEQPKHDRAKVEPKVPVPHILIQDFSDGVGDGCTVGVEEEGKLSSRERRRRRREQQRREKEEEKLQKKREKELEKEEKEKKKERRKPQTRGKSFQVQPSHAPLFGISGSKTFGSKRNSTPSTEAYF